MLNVFVFNFQEVLGTLLERETGWGREREKRGREKDAHLRREERRRERKVKHH